MEYLFVYADGGWWLKIDSIKKLTDYHEKMKDDRYEDAFLMYLHEGSPDKILENLSLEERMACGIGACYACVCHKKGDTTGAKSVKVCDEGPIFKASEVIL